MSTKKKSTKTKLKDPVAKAVIRSIGSIFIILSGILLFSDKIFEIYLTNTFGFADSQTFIWVFTQSISPILLMAGAVLRTYRIAYTVPLYFYFIQLYWVFDSSLKWDDYLLHVYALGVALFFCLTVIIVSTYFNFAFKNRNEQISLLEEMLDLSIDLRKLSK